ncbi:MAG: glycosaminoglycan attachment protein, partial [Candidatus Neomarinimicrobiota bacterium]
MAEQENAMPIRFGSPLYSKLQKRYWDLPHVTGHPLVFAIADFHDDQSMLWSSTSLIDYLYGFRYDF